MEKFRKARIWLTILAMLCLLGEWALTAVVTQPNAGGSLVTVMWIVCVVGVAAFCVSAGLAIAELIRLKRKK